MKRENRNTREKKIRNHYDRLVHNAALFWSDYYYYYFFSCPQHTIASTVLYCRGFIFLLLKVFFNDRRLIHTNHFNQPTQNGFLFFSCGLLFHWSGWVRYCIHIKTIKFWWWIDIWVCPIDMSKVDIFAIN